MERGKRKEMSPGENRGVVEERKKKKKKMRKEEERETAEAEEPTTEEVEEFYAILRRMDDALRYLKGKRLTERRTTAETVAVVENKELNLNEMPSDSTN